jgi:hypothetical protein
MKNLAMFLGILLMPVLVWSQAVQPVLLPSIRLAALGGPHAAGTSGVDALFENPAGFATETRTTNIASLIVQVSGPVFDMANLVLDGTLDPENLLAGLMGLLDAANRLYVQVDTVAPISFAYVGSGLGFGLFNRTTATVNATSLLHANLRVQEDLLLAGGYAHRFRLGQRLLIDVGIMPKAFIQTVASVSGSLDVLQTLVGNPENLMTALPFSIVTGLAIDAGMRWTWDNTLAIGLVGRDAYSLTLSSSHANLDSFIQNPLGAWQGEPAFQPIEPDLSVGLAWYAPFAFLRRWGADFSLFVDYRDILTLLNPYARNPVLNVGAGAELVLLDILSFRAGINEGLLAAGIGLDLTLFTFNLAMFGRELGREPGMRPVYNLALGLDFRY